MRRRSGVIGRCTAPATTITAVDVTVADADAVVDIVVGTVAIAAAVTACPHGCSIFDVVRTVFICVSLVSLEAVIKTSL